MEENIAQEEEGQYEIPVKGSLGLLAAGYKGVMLWRMKRLGIKNTELKIVPPIVFGKILKLANIKKETPKDKEDE